MIRKFILLLYFFFFPVITDACRIYLLRCIFSIFSKAKS